MEKEMFLDQIRTNIDIAEIVSFDIFDTLLLRPYCSPSDLFHHIEYLENQEGFSAARILAEDIARKKNQPYDDITIDEIYTEIEDEFKYLKNTEIELEKKLLFRNEEMWQVYRYAREHNKKIIITSDMYLPSSSLKEVLHRNGICDYDKFYLSCEYRKSKFTGKLFHQIINDYPYISPDKILHIGDNKQSDYTVPSTIGFFCVRYKKILDQFLDSDKRASLFYAQRKDLSDSILLAYMAKSWNEERFIKKSDYWYSIGKRYAGPVSYSYASFIHDECIKKSIDEVLFIARDGYNLKKAFDYISSNVKSHYIYAPRLFNEIFNIDISSHNHTKIIKYFNDYIKTNNLPHDKNKDISECIHGLSYKLYKEYKNLITSMVKTEKIAMVDSITINFSAQKLLEKVFNTKIKAFYWYIVPSKNKKKFDTIIFSGDDEKINITERASKHWPFMEFLLSSPELPVRRVDSTGRAIYIENPSEYELLRSSIYPMISNGAQNFVSDIVNCFSKTKFPLTCFSVIKWINLYIDYPEKIDFENMKRIKVGNDSFHTEYIPLFCDETSFKDFILNYKKTKKNLKRLVWKTNFQKIYCNIKKIIKVKFKSNGIRKLHILISPGLEKTYFILSLNFSQKWNYRFVIGNDNIYLNGVDNAN